MKKQPEYDLQKRVCQWLNENYKDVLYMTDSIAAVKLTLPQAARNKAVQKPNFKCPDLIIFEPTMSYRGLFIELKTKSPFKKDGKLRKCPHLEAQQRTIEDLRHKGYKALFSWGYDMTVIVIENYMYNR